MKDTDAASRTALRGNEKAKLIVMGVALLFLAIAYVTARRQEDKHHQAERGLVPEEEELAVERIVLPVFGDEDIGLVNETVEDGNEGQRVVLETEALNLLQDYSRLLRDAHFEALGVEVLEGDRLAVLLTDPQAHRVRAYRVRGTVLRSLHRQREASRPSETIGLLDVEGGTGPVHFVALDVPEEWAITSEETTTAP